MHCCCCEVYLLCGPNLKDQKLKTSSNFKLTREMLGGPPPSGIRCLYTAVLSQDLTHENASSAWPYHMAHPYLSRNVPFWKIIAFSVPLQQRLLFVLTSGRYNRDHLVELFLEKCYTTCAETGRTGAGILLDSSRAGIALDICQFEAVVLQITQRHSTVSKKV